MSKNYDFCGWVTRNNIVCSDGRIIRKDAFAHCDGLTVPMIWNHKHADAKSVLGKITLENREDGVYGYGVFNDSPEGQHAKEAVKHGDVTSMSIFANKLRQNGADVIHGMIREVSLVLAGANPGALIEEVMYHSDEYDSYDAQIYYEEIIGESYIEHAEEDEKVAEEEKKEPEKKERGEKTIEDVINTMNEEQKTAMYAIVGAALEEAKNSDSNEGGNEDMKHNLFENKGEVSNQYVLCHSDEVEIMKMAKDPRYGTLQNALAEFKRNKSDELQHGFASDEDIETLFPEYELLKKGAPEMITSDQTWIDGVMAGVTKSPFSRVRTRQADVRNKDGINNQIRALGYVKGKKKKEMGNIQFLKRSTDPQTVYIKDSLNRDDIIDITDFDATAYQYQIMRMALNEEIAMAIMVGDRRSDDSEDKIFPEHIRPIWLDDELYTIHTDIDIAAAKAELQGGDTAKYFGDNYVYAEAIITAALYSRERFKGSGQPVFYCTPHLVNVMLLARDRNGRRIYSSISELASALNVSKIETAEQFEGLTRTDKAGKKHELLGLFVNLKDYQVGSTKGGQITKFEQFDIDFNQEKYLLETRLSGALTRVWSAIALEMPADDGSQFPTNPIPVPDISGDEDEDVQG